MYIAAVETCADTYTTIINFLISLFSQQKKRQKGQPGQRKDDLHTIALNSEKKCLILADTFFDIFTKFETIGYKPTEDFVKISKKVSANIKHFFSEFNAIVCKSSFLCPGWPFCLFFC
jgi:hypothetical protein